VSSHEVDDEADIAWASRALDDGRDPLTDDAGRLRLSFTRIDTFEQCPRRFRYQYVDALPSRPAPQLSFGSSVHAVLEWLFDRKHPVLPSVEETLDALKQRWESTGYVDVPREQQLEAYAHARQVVSDFHARVAAVGFRLPAATEQWFELPFPDQVVVVGAIDRVDVDPDGSLRVLDYKTSRRARTRGQVARSLQLAIYALAARELYGRLPATVALDFVVPGLTVEIPVDELDLADVPRRVAEVARRVRAREDAPTPNRLCDWCDFRDLCPAWEGDGEATLGRALRDRESLGRSLARDVRRLRQLDATLAALVEAGHGTASALPGGGGIVPAGTTDVPGDERGVTP
jgi:putative RecB family exonuclease